MAPRGTDDGCSRPGTSHGISPAPRSAVAETADAATSVLDVPADLAGAFAYRAWGSSHVPGAGGRRAAAAVVLLMSSAPGVDAELAVTVKRGAGRAGVRTG